MAAMNKEKVKDAEKLVKKADKLTKLSFTRWFPDWAAATPLYEQAALSFKLGKMPEAAKCWFERAAIGQERLSSQWTAGKHLEAAGAMAKEIGSWEEVADFFKRASELYVECGKAQPGADALTRGAKALEEAKPDEAVKMYMSACSMLEDDGREQMAFDIYRPAANMYIKLQRYQEAASVLLRWGQAADTCKAVQSQCKAYVSAIIVYLYAGNIREAQQCQNDCSQIDVFFKSDQYRCGQELLSAYEEDRPDEIKHVVSTSSVIPYLDHMIIRLAKELPVGYVKGDVKGAISDDNFDEDDLS